MHYTTKKCEGARPNKIWLFKNHSIVADVFDYCMTSRCVQLKHLSYVLWMVTVAFEALSGIRCKFFFASGNISAKSILRSRISGVAILVWSFVSMVVKSEENHQYAFAIFSPSFHWGSIWSDQFIGQNQFLKDLRKTYTCIPVEVFRSWSNWLLLWKELSFYNLPIQTLLFRKRSCNYQDCLPFLVVLHRFLMLDPHVWKGWHDCCPSELSS